MSRFSYIGRKSSGERSTGIVDALSQDEAVLQLQQQGLVITAILPLEMSQQTSTGKAPSHIASRKKSQFTHTGVRATDMVIMARQLALLLGAGVSLLRSLDIIGKQVDSKSLFDVMMQVRQDMEGGRTLRDAMAKFPKIFGALWINLVETGEASGNLPLVLEKLAYYLEESMAFRRKILSAMLYPGILLFISVSAVMFFVMKIIPTFAGILEQFGVPLPLATRVVIPAFFHWFPDIPHTWLITWDLWAGLVTSIFVSIAVIAGIASGSSGSSTPTQNIIVVITGKRD